MADATRPAWGMKQPPTVQARCSTRESFWPLLAPGSRKTSMSDLSELPTEMRFIAFPTSGSAFATAPPSAPAFAPIFAAVAAISAPAPTIPLPELRPRSAAPTSRRPDGPPTSCAALRSAFTAPPLASRGSAFVATRPTTSAPVLSAIFTAFFSSQGSAVLKAAIASGDFMKSFVASSATCFASPPTPSWFASERNARFTAGARASALGASTAFVAVVRAGFGPAFALQPAFFGVLFSGSAAVRAGFAFGLLWALLVRAVGVRTVGMGTQCRLLVSVDPLVEWVWYKPGPVSADLADGQAVQVKGSGSSVYTLKNSGGVYSCTCPAWMHQSVGIERRTCKHLRAYRGDQAETARLGAFPLTGKPARPPRPQGASSEGGSEEEDGEGPPILLAHKWENDVDLTGWWISEKLDGVRAYWDGERFISRLGNAFFAPKWFTAALPKVPLDGELWGGRKLFQRTVGIVKRQDESPLWKELKYVVFDAPKHGGVFEERVAFIDETLTALKTAWLTACEHVACRGVEHLKAELARVEGLGGEGLMVRQPRSRYEAGRSSTLLKVKSFHDTEARVLEHVPGMGRHKGRLGALLVELADGTRFNVGTGFSDAERENPPKVGAIITFRYQELSNAGVPRFPSYVGERIDGRLPGGHVRRVEAIRSSSSPAVTEPPAPSPATPRGPMPLRRFEMTDGDTRYFWEIETTGSKQKIRFGTFEEKEKVFEDDDEAKENAEKKIAEKLGKGFKEVGGAGVAAAAKKKSPFDDEDDDDAPPVKKSAAAAPAPAAAAAPAASKKTSGGAGARYFEFIEGTSSKFWEIRVEGTTFFTRYGKIGTDGQVTQKDWDSPERAQAEASKLVNEKVKKGYQEK